MWLRGGGEAVLCPPPSFSTADIERRRERVFLHLRYLLLGGSLGSWEKLINKYQLSHENHAGFIHTAGLLFCLGEDLYRFCSYTMHTLQLQYFPHQKVLMCVKISYNELGNGTCFKVCSLVYADATQSNTFFIRPLKIYQKVQIFSHICNQ